jgi:hypothetical protein
MDHTTRLRQWIEGALAEGDFPSLREIVAERRGQGDSWQAVAVKVTAASGHAVTVQTLINWFGPADGNDAA